MNLAQALVIFLKECPEWGQGWLVHTHGFWNNDATAVIAFMNWCVENGLVEAESTARTRQVLQSF